MDQKLILPILMGALVLFAIYRRVRRNIGRQAVSVKRMQFRVGILCVIGALFALSLFVLPFMRRIPPSPMGPGTGHQKS